MESLDYFYDALYLALGAFTIWMLVDAYRRGAETVWFWVILFAPGIGPWVYFFAVKAADWRRPREWSFWQRRASLKELRYRAETMPSLTNRLALAERLIEQHECDEALPHLIAVLNQEPDLCPALYALAICRAEAGQPEEAVPLLQKIIARERIWSNYAAWHRLVEVQAESGAGDKALATCRELARLAPTLQHQCLLAEHLLAQGRNDEAREVLERSLKEHQFAPGFIRRRNRQWASRARQMQRQVPAG